MKIQLVSFAVQSLFFQRSFSGFTSKAIKLLFIALSVFRIDLPSAGQYGKGRGQYIPELTSLVKRKE